MQIEGMLDVGMFVVGSLVVGVMSDVGCVVFPQQYRAVFAKTYYSHTV